VLFCRDLCYYLIRQRCYRSENRATRTKIYSGIARSSLR